jgi:hypothetical protein
MRKEEEEAAAVPWTEPRLRLLPSLQGQLPGRRMVMKMRRGE